MKRVLISLVLIAPMLFAGEVKKPKATPADVIRVATALDHLTVLEFAEPVVMAAAGSNDFQIERHDDKVLIKPIKAGASTNLFIWTATKRFSYELESPGEVGDMNFAIDNRNAVPQSAPTATPRLQMDEIADMVLTKALLGAEEIQSAHIKDRNGRVTVRIEHVFRTANTLYIHYSISNQTSALYRVATPVVRQIAAPHTKISLVPLKGAQLDDAKIHDLGVTTQAVVTMAHAEVAHQDLASGDRTQGVVAIRQQLPSPTVFELEFGSQGGNRVRAVFIR